MKKVGKFLVIPLSITLASAFTFPNVSAFQKPMTLAEKGGGQDGGWHGGGDHGGGGKWKGGGDWHDGGGKGKGGGDWHDGGGKGKGGGDWHDGGGKWKGGGKDWDHKWHGKKWKGHGKHCDWVTTYKYFCKGSGCFWHHGKKFCPGDCYWHHGKKFCPTSKCGWYPVTVYRCHH